MKITLLTPALVAILGLALADAPITARAQIPTPTPTSTPTPDTSSTTDKKYTGSIKAISDKSITVEVKKKDVTLAITPKTKFKKDKVSSSAKDFGVGDKVTIVAHGKDAKSVDLHKDKGTTSSNKTTS